MGQQFSSVRYLQITRNSTVIRRPSGRENFLRWIVHSPFMLHNLIFYYYGAGVCYCGKKFVGSLVHVETREINGIIITGRLRVYTYMRQTVWRQSSCYHSICWKRSSSHVMLFVSLWLKIRLTLRYNTTRKCYSYYWVTDNRIMK